MEPERSTSGSETPSHSNKDFRSLSLELLNSDGGDSSLEILRDLRALQKPEATWEAVFELLVRLDSFPKDPDEGLRQSMAGALQCGSESQLADLRGYIAGAPAVLDWRHKVAAEAVASQEELRVEWCRELVGDEPLRRLRAAELLSAAKPGALSNQESWAVAKYLFERYQDDSFVARASFRGDAVARLAMTPEAIGDFYFRHSGSGALAVAEAGLRRNPMLAFIAARVLVEYGDQQHRERAFDLIVSSKWPLVDKFENWSEEALSTVEPKLVAVVTELTAPSDVVSAAIAALSRLPGGTKHEGIVIDAARRQPLNREVQEAVVGMLTSNGVSEASLQFARQLLLPANSGSFLLKSPSEWFAFQRPSELLVETAMALFESAQSSEGELVYRRALAARDISGDWVRGPSRVLLATRLPCGDGSVEGEVLRAREEDLRAAVGTDERPLLALASRSSLEVGLRVLNAVLAAKSVDGRAVVKAHDTLQAMRRRHPGEGDLSTMIEFCVRAARQYLTASVRSDLCACFYDSVETAPQAVVPILQARLSECARQVESGLSSARQERASLQRLLGADGTGKR
jgi:hypothetical protein